MNHLPKRVALVRLASGEQGDRMRRRRLLQVCVAPFALTMAGLAAQTPPNSARIGILNFSRPGTPEWDGFLDFMGAMSELGWEEKRNVEYVHRFADSDHSRFEPLAAELAAEKVDVVFAGLGDMAKAISRAAPSMPVVFAVSADPVASGIVASLARPGGNVTGFSTSNAELGAKRVQLLREIRPDLQRLAMLDSTSLRSVSAGVVANAAGELGLQFQHFKIERVDELAGAFDAMVRWKADALVVVATVLLVREQSQVIEHAARTRLPAIFGMPAPVERGGLMSYNANFSENYRRAAGYVDRILKGAKPSDLPVQQPTKFELLINLKTAKALGITIPQSLLLRADEVLE